LSPFPVHSFLPTQPLPLDHYLLSLFVYPLNDTFSPLLHLRLEFQTLAQTLAPPLPQLVSINESPIFCQASSNRTRRNPRKEEEFSPSSTFPFNPHSPNTLPRPSESTRFQSALNASSKDSDIPLPPPVFLPPPSSTHSLPRPASKEAPDLPSSTLVLFPAFERFNHRRKEGGTRRWKEQIWSFQQTGLVSTSFSPFRPSRPPLSSHHYSPLPEEEDREGIEPKEEQQGFMTKGRILYFCDLGSHSFLLLSIHFTFLYLLRRVRRGWSNWRNGEGEREGAE